MSDHHPENNSRKIYGVPVHLVELTTKPPVAIWDFSQTKTLLETGYQQMKKALTMKKIPSSRQSAGWLTSLRRWFPFHKHEIRIGNGKDS